MIESLSDFLSVAVMAVLTLTGIYMFYQVNAKNYEANMKYLEERYYRYYEDSDNTFDEDNASPFDDEEGI